MEEMSSARVILWGAPRCTSNLFARCMTGIPGNEIWIEPYVYSQFAHNEMHRMGLTKEGEPLPYSYDGNEEVFEKAAGGMGTFLGSTVKPQRLPYAAVKRNLEGSVRKHVFVKDFGIAVHSDFLRQYLPVGFKHTFLIRHPYLAFRSYRKSLSAQQVSSGRMNKDDEANFDISLFGSGPGGYVEDFFVKNHALWKYVRENIDPNPVVVDSSELLRNPARIISKYCEAVGLPYSDSLLTWEATPAAYRTWRLVGDDIMDNAENFVGTLMRSTGFKPPSEVPSRDELTSDVIRASDASMACYEEMYASRIV